MSGRDLSYRFSWRAAGIHLPRQLRPTAVPEHASPSVLRGPYRSLPQPLWLTANAAKIGRCTASMTKCTKSSSVIHSRRSGASCVGVLRRILEAMRRITESAVFLMLLLDQQHAFPGKSPLGSRLFFCVTLHSTRRVHVDKTIPSEQRWVHCGPVRAVRSAHSLPMDSSRSSEPGSSFTTTRLVSTRMKYGMG